MVFETIRFGRSRIPPGEMLCDRHRLAAKNAVSSAPHSSARHHRRSPSCGSAADRPRSCRGCRRRPPSGRRLRTPAREGAPPRSRRRTWGTARASPRARARRAATTRSCERQPATRAARRERSGRRGVRARCVRARRLHLWPVPRQPRRPARRRAPRRRAPRRARRPWLRRSIHSFARPRRSSLHAGTGAACARRTMS